MESKQQEANASSFTSDLLEAGTDEDGGPLGVDSKGLEGVAVRPQGLSSHEQGNVELLIQFDEDESVTPGILQPQRTGKDTEIHSDDERQDEENNYKNRQSNSAVYSKQHQPQKASIDDDDEGSSQKWLPYETTDAGFGTLTDDDLHDDDDDEYKHRYVLNPQEFRIHVGTEADINFGMPGNVPHAQNTEQHEPPQLLFTTDEGADYTTDEEFGYIREAEPSPPEADLDVEDEALELQFEPDVEDDPDGDEIPHSRRTQPSAPEDELEIAQEYPELQFEPEDVTQHDGDEMAHIRHTQPSAPEDELEIAQEYPELQFEPEDGVEQDGDEIPYIRRTQPSAPEDELEPAQEYPELQFEPEDCVEQDGDEIPYIRRTQPSAPEDDLEPAQEFHELQFEPEDGVEQDGDEMAHIRHTQPSAPEDELEIAQEHPELQFEPEDAVEQDGDDIDRYLRQYQPSAPQDVLENAQESSDMQFEAEDAGQHDRHDTNRYFRASPPVPEDDLEPAQDSPELQFEPENAAGDDDDDTDRYFRASPPAPEDDLEHAQGSPELQFEPENAADHDDDDTDRYFRASPPAPEDDLEHAQGSPELQFEPENAADDDDDTDRYLRASQPAPEDDLEPAQDSPELQYEPESAADHDHDDDTDRYFRASQPVPKDDLEPAQDSPELQFEPENAAGDDDDDVDRYFRASPPAPEDELEPAQDSPELKFEPENAADYDDDAGRYFRASPPAPEDDLEPAQDSPELQFEPENAADHDDDTDRYLRASQSAPEDDLEPAQDSPELKFEPENAAGYDDDTGRYFRASPPAPEDDLEPAHESPELQFEPESAADHDDDDDAGRYFRVSQPAPEDDLEPAQDSPELQFEPENAADHDDDDDNDGDDHDDDTGRYFRVSPPAPVDDLENAHESPEMQFAPEAERDHDNGEDVTPYFASSGTLAPKADTEAVQESPELHFEPDDDEDQRSYHSQSLVPEADLDVGFPVRHSDQYGDDESGEDDEGNGCAPESQRVHDTDKEIPVDDNIDNGDLTHYQTSAQQGNQDVSAQQFKAADYGDDDGDGGVSGDDDGSDHTSQLRSAVQANFEDESRQLESPPSNIPYAIASHDGDDDNDSDGRNYTTHGGEDQGLGEHHIAAGPQSIEDDEDSPRILIKGILSEGNFDERFDGNEYEEENEDDDDDNDDPIDIRDNANVEDQFIEFEETPFVEAAVGGVLEDVGLNGAENECQKESVGNEAGGEDEGEGDATASGSRVRFAEDDDNRHPDAEADDVDDYHIIPGASNQPSYSSHEYDLAEGEEKSLDVLLLEEICEEAASMTIKEALIHSLKPNVRAGLTTAHLKLSESEVLALEEYCEDFVGGLIKDLLKRSSLIDLSRKNTKNVVKASVIKSTAKQLSAMEVQQMKVYCDHFVHNVIAESIIDSSMIVARQQHQAEEVKELLHMFQNSGELQEYFTNLTTDIVRTALLNVTAKEELQNDNQDIEQPINSTEYEQTESAEGLEFGDQEEDFDFDGGHSFGFLAADNKSPEYRRSRSQESWTSEDDGGMGAGVDGRRERMTERSPPGHSTLEFDEEWAEGVIGNIELTPDGERRQKIFMRELEFDDRANVGGTELLAPVFLAVAEENEDDTEFEGLRRKTQSIEDLCDLIEEEKEPPRKRASSLTQLAKKKPKPRKKPRPNSFREQMEELKKEAIKENIPDAEEERPAMSPESPSSPKTSSEKSFQAYDDERYRWHTIRVNNREKVLDLKLIEPYMKVITHGGVHMPTRAVIVVIAACYLPDKTKRNYDFLMEQLFFYLISTLELLATTDEYFLVYFNGGTTQNNQPALPWMKRFYQHVEGGLKKNMIHMFIVHPNFWLKTVVRFAKAFVGTNFWSKLQFIKSLDELSTKIPIEFIYVPDEVIRCDPKYRRVHNL